MESYLNINFKFTKLIFEACKRLQLSSASLYAACSIYHTLNEKVLTSQFPNEFQLNPSLLAVTSLYLASKLEEESPKIRDVVNVCHRILFPDDVPLNIGQKYWNLRDSVLNFEIYLLRIIQFDVSYDYPQKYLLSYLNSLRPWVKPVNWAGANVSQMAWNLLQDSFHLPIKGSPAIFALAILKLAVDITSLEISCKGTLLIWWKAFCADATEADLKSIAYDVLEVLRYESKRRHKVYVEAGESSSVLYLTNDRK